MKKLIAVLMTIALMCTCALAETADYTGMWYLNYMIQGETTIEAATMGFVVTMEIKDDGTVIMSGIDETTEGTWSMTDTGIEVNDGESTQALVLEDGNLTANEEGMGMIFGRELVNNAYVPAEKRTDTALEEFNGSWAAVSVYMFGMNVPYESIGATSTIEITDGVIVLTDTLGEDVEPTTTEYTSELADGVLTISSAPDEYGNTNTCTMYLLADGVLVIDQTTEDLGEVYVYYTPIEK